jgi:diguanylate cyclase (GGDEF)-like protein
LQADPSERGLDFANTALTLRRPALGPARRAPERRLPAEQHGGERQGSAQAPLGRLMVARSNRFLRLLRQRVKAGSSGNSQISALKTLRRIMVLMLLKFVLSRSGLVVISLAQMGLFFTIFIAFFGMRMGPLPAVMAISLALLNTGFILIYQRFKALEESARRLSLLARMNVQVNREILLNEDIELIYSTILNYLFSIFNTATTGSILILSDDGYLHFAASHGFTEEFVNDFHLKLEDSFLYQATAGVITEARLIAQKEFLQLETVFKPGKWEYQSVISAPLFVGDRLFGLLNLDSSVSGTYDDKDVEIVEQFRTQIEVGLLARERYTANIQRYQVDALTGLLTRRYFEDLFKRALDRALRHQEGFVIAMFDVDGLKYVNDTFGHLAGDQLLMLIANALRTSCRNSDVIGRFGGDEFIASYHASEIGVIEKKIAGIRTELRSKSMYFNTKKVCRSSFSYGLARFPQDGADQPSLIAVADKRLYAMKNAPE